jgi:hypothetical protein
MSNNLPRMPSIYPNPDAESAQAVAEAATPVRQALGVARDVYGFRSGATINAATALANRALGYGASVLNYTDYGAERMRAAAEADQRMLQGMQPLMTQSGRDNLAAAEARYEARYPSPPPLPARLPPMQGPPVAPPLPAPPTAEQREAAAADARLRAAMRDGMSQMGGNMYAEQFRTMMGAMPARPTPPTAAEMAARDLLERARLRDAQAQASNPSIEQSERFDNRFFDQLSILLGEGNPLTVRSARER